MFDQSVIQQFIPHRPPFLLIDEIMACTPFESVRSMFKLEPDAWYFQGHFPHNPVFPGVLSLECMGQTAAFLMTYSCDQIWGNKNIYLMSIDQAKFRHAAKPGDILSCVVKLVRRKGNIFKLYGEIHMDAEMICSAYCMLMMSE
jgi:3-hydroxyacyl-[acyl-carrier-protein] dehydratase